MTRVSQWNWTDWGQEWSQTRAINEIDVEIRQDRAASVRRLRQAKAELASGLSKVDSRLDSVADRVDVVLEWTELRFQLLEFDEYEARKAIRKPFLALASGRPAAPIELADVHGYWLPPAAAALLPLLLRDRGGAASVFTDLQAGLETARGRDPVRAELFNLTAALCFDQPAFVDAAVLRLLGDAPDLGLAEPGQVAQAWRTLWVHAAAGEFGPGATALLEDRLKSLFELDSLDETELRAWDQAIRSFGEADGSDDPFGRLGAHLAVSAPATGAEAPVPDDLWRSYLQELIEEPSPAELPIVRAMEELHLPQNQLERSSPTWSQAQGTVARLLRGDLFDAEGDPTLRALALRLGAPLLRSRIEAMSGGNHDTTPITKTVKRMGVRLTVGRDGHRREDLAEAERLIERREAVAGPTASLIALAVGIAVFAVVAGVLAQNWLLSVFLLLGTALPVLANRRRRDRVREAEHSAQKQIKQLRAELDRARDQIIEAERLRDQRQDARRSSTEAILARLDDV